MIPFWLVLGTVGVGCAVLTRALLPVVAWLSYHFDILDKPDGGRKQHAVPTPLLGGLAIGVPVIASLLAAVISPVWEGFSPISSTLILSILLGVLILLFGGVCDDRFGWKPHQTVWFPLVSIALVMFGGLRVPVLTNPFGENVFFLTGILSVVLPAVWLLVTIYTTKLLDGIDGLASTIGALSMLIMLCLTLTTRWFQPDVAFLLVGVFGSITMFLTWNRAPARLFLGEGGSTLIGFLIGVFAVISGAKIATALLVCALPMCDLFFVVMQRFRVGGWKRILRGDRLHLHHRLLDAGWSARRVVLFYALIAFSLGVVSLWLGSFEKLLLILLVPVIWGVVMLYVRPSR